MTATYTFSIQNDFPNQAVSTDRLTLEIQQSAITVALSGITTSGDVCQIIFKTSLATNEVTILDGLVAAHSGLALKQSVISDTYFVAGYTATSNATRANIFATFYGQQLTGSQRSIVSTSAADATGSTGAQIARITYYDQSLAGPFTEDLALQGTTAVNTVSDTICFIESVNIITVGSDGNNQGSIFLMSGVAGGGDLVAFVAANDNQTNYCHHHISLGKTFYLSQVICGNQGTSAGSLTVLKTQPTVVNTPDFVIIPQIRIPTGETAVVNFVSPIRIDGPARVLLQIKQDISSGTNNWFAGFSYQEI